VFSRVSEDVGAQDTDGDGAVDSTEASSAADPTLYDAAPPEVDVWASGYRIPENSLAPTYWVDVRITDDAGVEQASLVKDGEARVTETYEAPSGRSSYGYDDTEIDDRLEFTDQAISPEEVDTSSIKRTFVSFGGAARDFASDVTGAVADVTLGTTVYVRASDENANSKRVVGVQRENFYGALAGSLYTGNEIADGAIAAEFGKISGFSASVGQVFADLSMLIEVPEAIVEGMIALFELIQQEGAHRPDLGRQLREAVPAKTGPEQPLRVVTRGRAFGAVQDVPRELVHGVRGGVPCEADAGRERPVGAQEQQAGPADRFAALGHGGADAAQ